MNKRVKRPGGSHEGVGRKKRCIDLAKAMKALDGKKNFGCLMYGGNLKHLTDLLLETKSCIVAKLVTEREKSASSLKL